MRQRCSASLMRCRLQRRRLFLTAVFPPPSTGIVPSSEYRASLLKLQAHCSRFVATQSHIRHAPTAHGFVKLPIRTSPTFARGRSRDATLTVFVSPPIAIRLWGETSSYTPHHPTHASCCQRLSHVIFLCGLTQVTLNLTRHRTARKASFAW